MSPIAFASYATALPAGQAKVETAVLLPSVRANIPNLLATAGALWKVVPRVAIDDNLSNSTAPEPDKEYEDVSRSSCRGRRKFKEHVLPAYEAGMSKLKIVDVLGEMVPKYDVPAAVSGDEEEIGIIR